MAKNRASFLADIVLNTRSNAYKELCAMCTDENGFQSDKAAMRLRSEMKSVLTDLLKGNFESVNERLAKHGRRPPVVAIRRPLNTMRRGSLQWDSYSITKRIRIAEGNAYLQITHSNEATPEELLYGVLRRALENGDIEHLALCRKCGKLFYRKSSKGRFCGNNCRWAYFNSYKERQARYKRLLEKRRRRPTRITPYGPRKKTAVPARQ